MEFLSDEFGQFGASLFANDYECVALGLEVGEDGGPVCYCYLGWFCFDKEVDRDQEQLAWG